MHGTDSVGTANINADMNTFVISLGFYVVVFRHVVYVSSLEVRIETIEDDGTKDLWTFEDSSLKSQS